MASAFFTEDHELFRQSVANYVSRRLRPRAQEWEALGAVPREVWKEMGDLGFLGIRAPEAWGGSGLDYWYTVAFIEELCKSETSGLNLGIAVQTDLATPIIWELGTDYHKENFLRPAIRGDAIAALGISEPAAGSDVAAITTTAKRVGDDYVIDGQKTFITNGTRADFITLLVRTDATGHKGLSLVLFPTDTPGFKVGRALSKIGNHTSDTAELFFDGCKIPTRNRLGDENRGFHYVMKNFDGERLIAALVSIQSAQMAIDHAVAYGKERKAFGRPILDQQVWRHRLVEHMAAVEAGRRLTYHACDLFNHKRPCTKEITMAKLYTCDLVQRVVYDCQQLFGGMGYMTESFIGRLFCDMRLMTIGGGTAEIMKEILAKIALPS